MSKAKLSFDGHAFDVQVLRLAPTDKIVISSTGAYPLSADVAAQIKERAAEVFGDNEIVVLQGLGLSIVREGEAA